MSHGNICNLCRQYTANAQTMCEEVGDTSWKNVCQCKCHVGDSVPGSGRAKIAMKFKVGDKVKETRPPYTEGEVVEANLDQLSFTGEWYLIDCGGSAGNQWSNGEGFVLIETDFV